MKKLMVVKSIEAREKIGENSLLRNVNWNKIINYTKISQDLQEISKKVKKLKKMEEFELGDLKENLVVCDNNKLEA